MSKKKLHFSVAASLWLVAFIACYRRQIVMINKSLNARLTSGTEESDKYIKHDVWGWPLASLLSPTLQPILPPLFTLSNKELFCKKYNNIQQCTGGIMSQVEEEDLIRKLSHQEEKHVFYLHMLLEFYGHRARVPIQLRPTKNELLEAYRTVVQRSIPLPVRCTISAPQELSEFLEDHPEIPLLPSLVPVIDIIRNCNVCNVCEKNESPSIKMQSQRNTENYNNSLDEICCGAKKKSESEQTKEDSNSHDCKNANCTLYTCAQHDFTSASSRKRLPLDLIVTSARRVVVCATRTILPDEELLFDFD